MKDRENLSIMITPSNDKISSRKIFPTFPYTNIELAILLSWCVVGGKGVTDTGVYYFCTKTRCETVRTIMLLIP